MRSRKRANTKVGRIGAMRRAAGEAAAAGAVGRPRCYGWRMAMAGRSGSDRTRLGSKPKRRDMTGLGQRRGRKRRAGNEGLGADDEVREGGRERGKRALSPRGEGQGREVRVLLGQGMPLVPPQGSTHLGVASQV